MKKILLLVLTVSLCLTLCSCETILKKAKSMVTGEEVVAMPEDYIATLENDEYSYELYEDYVKVVKYLVEDGNEIVDIPSEIDGKPVTTIGSLCFYDIKTAVTSVNIPDSVTVIEESAFYYCDKLTAITIPDSVTKIGSRAFAWCNSLESVTFGKSVDEIPDFCFNHCSSLVTVVIPESISKIGVRAFSYCEILNEVDVSANVSSIGERAFSGCAELKFVIFGDKEISIGEKMFENSDNVVVIAPDASNAKKYCEDNGLRWSTSKDIEAVKLGTTEESSEDSSSIVG